MLQIIMSYKMIPNPSSTSLVAMEQLSHKKHSSAKHRKKHRRHYSSSSSSDSESKSPFLATTSDQETNEERRKRKERKRKDKRNKKHESKKGGKDRDSKKDHKKEKRKKRRHHSDDSDDEDRKKKRRLLKEAKEVLKKHKSSADGSAGTGRNKAKDLSEEDYFEKNKEFSTWLKEEHGIYFSTLSSEETRTRFQEFVKLWNVGKLSKKYYEGIESAPRTSHNWEIRGGKTLAVDREEEEFKRKLEKTQIKKFRKEHEELLEELAPKVTGRERLLEKKSVRREQARTRDDSPELMRDGDIMGGGDDFKKRLARERARRQKKAAERADAINEKRSAAEEREAAAMDQLRALVDMAGGKITIPKRQDPA